MSKIIRFILTLALIYGAYTETGFFTALSLLLIFFSFELQSWLEIKKREHSTNP